MIRYLEMEDGKRGSDRRGINQTFGRRKWKGVSSMIEDDQEWLRFYFTDEFFISMKRRRDCVVY